MPEHIVFLDTNILKAVRSCYIAQEKPNRMVLDKLGEYKLVYETVAGSPGNDYAFITSVMCMVELKVVHIKNALFEYAREIHAVPPDTFYDRRSNVLSTLQPHFNKEKLREVVEDFASYDVLRQVRMVPEPLSQGERELWQRKHDRVFQAIPNFESIQTQDAYILAAALVSGVTEVWSSDKEFRAAYNRLRNLPRSDFIEYIRDQAPDLFQSFDLVPIRAGPHAQSERSGE